MVKEITFEYSTRNDLESNEMFQLTFKKYDEDDEWELCSTNVNEFYVDATALFHAVDDAYRVLQKIYNIE